MPGDRPGPTWASLPLPKVLLGRLVAEILGSDILRVSLGGLSLLALGVLVLGAEAETLGQKSLPSLPSPFLPPSLSLPLFLLNERLALKPQHPSSQATCCSSVEITALEVFICLSAHF